MQRIMVVAVLAGLFGASGAGAQSGARGDVAIRIQPVVAMEVLPSGEGSPRSEGAYAVLDGAVRVRVSANAPWSLTVRREEEERKTASVGDAVGPVVGAMWVKAGVPAGVTARGGAPAPGPGFLPVTSGEVVVAEGGPVGGREVVLDYRWIAEGRDDGPPAGLVLEVRPR